MPSSSSASSDSVLDEIRSTIATFESLRSTAGHRRRATSDTASVAQSTILPVRTMPARHSAAASLLRLEAAQLTDAVARIKSALPTEVPDQTAAATLTEGEVLPESALRPEGTAARGVSEDSPFNLFDSSTAIPTTSSAATPSSTVGDNGDEIRPTSTVAHPNIIETQTSCHAAQAHGLFQQRIASAADVPGDEQPKSMEESAADHTVAVLETDALTSASDEQPVPASMRPERTPIVRFRTVDKSARIMIIDDEPLNVMTLRQHLKMEGYEHFVTTSDGREALRLLRAELPDVVLLDIRMPGINGMDILRVVSLDPVLQHIPVLILSAAADPETRKTALDLGASDFLHKPIEPNELLPRVRNAIVIKKHYDMAASEAARLEQQVERRTRQLEATRQQLILCLARAAEHRDNDTGNHVIRVGRYTSIIARAMGYPEHKLEMLEQAAQLHDVGKIGIPDSILFKPGKLDRDEYDLMKKHCALGKQIIEPISEKDWNILKTHTRIGESMLHVRSSSLLMLAARIAQTHHEYWDGNGYPLGLKGEDIPLEGRIVAVADVFDALSSRRPYKDPFPRQKCFDILTEGRGTQFDPRVIDAFFTCADEIVEVQLLLMDDEDRIPRVNHDIAAPPATPETFS